ncbi:MAG: tetratricopeptide repeat protein [Bryobacteraceae bacterium]
MSDAPHDLIASGYEARRRGRLDDARRLFSEAVEHCRGAADQAVLARSLTGLGQAERDLKNNVQALQYYGEAARIYRSLPDPLLFAHTIRHVGDILRHEGSMEQARTCYEDALAVYRDHADTPVLDLANSLRGFALLSVDAGETERAKALWQEARALYFAANVQPGVQESDAQIERLAGK